MFVGDETDGAAGTEGGNELYADEQSLQYMERAKDMLMQILPSNIREALEIFQYLIYRSHYHYIPKSQYDTSIYPNL